MKKIIAAALALLLQNPLWGAKPQASKPYTSEELTAAVLVAEAGGEGLKGMKAVYEVIKTRMKAKGWAANRVVMGRGAFSCITKYRSNPQLFVNKWKSHKRYKDALTIVKTYKSNELTKGANYYHEQTLRPHWSRGESPIAKVGRHLFFLLPL